MQLMCAFVCLFVSASVVNSGCKYCKDEFGGASFQQGGNKGGRRSQAESHLTQEYRQNTGKHILLLTKIIDLLHKCSPLPSVPSFSCPILSSCHSSLILSSFHSILQFLPFFSNPQFLSFFSNPQFVPVFTNAQFLLLFSTLRLFPWFSNPQFLLFFSSVLQSSS